MKNSVNKSIGVFLCGVCWSLIACFSAHAESKGVSEWEFQVTLYGWLAGQNGTVATLPGLPSTDIDVDFYDDILGNINFALFLVGEARAIAGKRPPAIQGLPGGGQCTGR